MHYEKTVRDTENDTARVSAHSTDGDVELWAHQSLGNCGAFLSFTPAKARKLAKALNRAANVAEGKPAKAPKPKEPATFIDEDGDYWERQEGGTYAIRWSDGTLSHVFCDKSYAEAVLDHGRLYPVTKGNA